MHQIPTLSDTRSMLARAGQEHILKFVDQLSDHERSRLLAQIAEIDFDSLPRLIEQYVHRIPEFRLPPDLVPAPYYPIDPGSNLRRWDRGAMKRAGEELLRRGRVAAFVVAGGQGSRLGYDGPKGCFPAGAVTGKSLFAFFADNLLAAKARHGVNVPWYIMTSPLNHAATVEFFESHRFFGLSKDDVMFFPQGVMPSVEMKTGRVLLSGKGEIATNPDGHGGSIKALNVSGALADMKRRGVEHISYFQVDNPCVRVLDPVFIGLHASASDSSAEMSSKMVPKTGPEEKVGVFCAAGADRRIRVIEYSDLPIELQRERLADGSLKFIAGSIAIHMLGVEFVERVASDPKFALPYHRAEKKIPCIDLESGEPVTPKENNGVKLERFVFDALENCRASILMETDRLEEFAPIKNASGVDSVESSKELQTERAAKWLEACGVHVPRVSDGPRAGKADCVIELSPRTAMSVEDLQTAILPKHVSSGQRIAL